MIQRILPSFRHTAASRGGSPSPRLTAPLAVGAVALAGLLLSLAPRAAGAQVTPSRTYTLSFTRTCALQQTDDAVFGLGDDEPYVLLFVGNLTTGSAVVKRTTVFSGVNSGECRDQTVTLWGPSGTAAAFPGNSPDNLLALVLPMEHDNCDVNNVQSSMDAALRSRLGQYRQQGLSRDRIVSQLRTDMAISAQCSVVQPWNPLQSEDRPIGFPQELRLSAADVSSANSGTSVTKTLTHDNRAVSIGGLYTTRFQLQATPLVLQP